MHLAGFQQVAIGVVEHKETNGLVYRQIAGGDAPLLHLVAGEGCIGRAEDGKGGCFGIIGNRLAGLIQGKTGRTARVQHHQAVVYIRIQRG